MLGNFFIWCAGSDKQLLSKCSNSERNKHIGYGTLVLVPAILAFVSMSYALSTVNGIEKMPWLSYLGGIIWALIIFSFDRFIVSTHRRKISNKEELQNPSFYLRFTFAFILGIVISHPLVMLYFDGSITDKIEANTVLAKNEIKANYDNQILILEAKVNKLDSLELVKTKQRDEQALIVAQEIDGEVISNAKGETKTTGLYGKGPSAENKILHLNQLQSDLDLLKAKNQQEKNNLKQEITSLRKEQQSKIQAYSVSPDYLRREMALQELKQENSIVGVTQWFLIFLFILVDILPVVFKTFAPFGMYDRILLDDSITIKELDNSSRRVFNQKVYEGISQI